MKKITLLISSALVLSASSVFALDYSNTNTTAPNTTNPNANTTTAPDNNSEPTMSNEKTMKNEKPKMVIFSFERDRSEDKNNTNPITKVIILAKGKVIVLRERQKSPALRLGDGEGFTIVAVGRNNMTKSCDFKSATDSSCGDFKTETLNNNQSKTHEVRKITFNGSL